MKKKKGRKTHRRTHNATVLQLQKRVGRLNEWRRRLSALLKYTREATTTTTLEELLILMAEEAKTVLRADRATVFLVDETRENLWSKVAIGAQNIRIPINKGIAGAVATQGEMLNIKDVYRDHRFNPEIDKKTGYRTETVLAAPMFNAKDEVIGVFQILNRTKGGSFDRQDEEILALLTQQAAANVENAQLYEEIRKTAQESIIRLASAVEYKDHDTQKHLFRMSQYCSIIAENMGFEKDWVENLRMAAPMHDIGKIGVPDAILNKPGKLNSVEWEEMKKHAQYGADILQGSSNELMKTSAIVALNHHERWDGNGYPRGIKGEEIPIEARIAALADVFDALTSKRIYKPNYSLEDTLKIVRQETGKHFDPDVVTAFFKGMAQVVPLMEKHAPKTDQLEIKFESA